jgi:hypothetical protein
MNPTRARPLFRVLALVLAIAGGFGTVVIGVVRLEQSTLEALGAFIGGGLFVLAMLIVAVSGRVPPSLAYFLAPPSAWEPRDKR